MSEIELGVVLESEWHQSLHLQAVVVGERIR